MAKFTMKKFKMPGFTLNQTKASGRSSSMLAALPVEKLEARQFFSAGAAEIQGAFNFTGASTGLTPAATTPRISRLKNLVNGLQTSATTNIDRDTTIVMEVELAGFAVAEPILRDSVRLFDNITNQRVATQNIKTSGGGDDVTVTPTEPLAANRTYRVEVNTGSTKIRDTNGVAFAAFTGTFTTGTYVTPPDNTIRFTKERQVTKAANSNGSFSSVTVGPDGKLYAGTLQGYIYRYDIDSITGALSNETRLNNIRANNGNQNRFITGLTFDPRSDSAEPILWVSHGQGKFNNADNHTGKISRLYGNNLSTYEDVIINIPRSIKDHLNNQISFDPSGKNLYFLIPSQSAMGAPDSTWGNRPEELTTAALFRLQLRSRGSRVGIEEWLAARGPINLDPLSRKPYNPYKGSNPLRFYATGIRNAYDMVWHSNGRLYLPANGSSSGGNAPATPSNLANVPSSNRLDFGTSGNYTGPTTNGISPVNQTEEDLLYDVEPGGYYGHPNPARGEYILNGGNPTSRTDPLEVRQYPIGTQPDRNFRGGAYSFDKNVSPNGVIEYKSNAFGPALKGSLIVARYNSGNDLIIVKPNANGTFNQSTAGNSGVTGFKSLESPLDLTEDLRTGFIYSVSLPQRESGEGRITLHRPIIGQLTRSRSRLSIYDTPDDGQATTRSITFTNNTANVFYFDRNTVKFKGTSRKLFSITNLESSYPLLRPGDSVTLTVSYNARGGDTVTRRANLVFASNDPANPLISVQVRGFPAENQSASFAAVKPVSKAFSQVSIVKDVFEDPDDTLLL
jgi:glucose/arabinose dehydrogenase